MKWIRALIVCGFAAAGAACTESEPKTVKVVNIATGGTSGVYYPLGLALARIYEEVLPETKFFVEVTQASAENLTLLQAGRGEVAFTLADVLSEAWRGEDEAGFRVPLRRLRVIAGMYPNYIQIVARADTGIKTLADLKGKRVSVGAVKSGTERNARKILRAAGLSYGDFARVEYLPFGESVELMKLRQLDVTLQSAGLGVTSLRELASAVNVVVIPIPEEVVLRVNDPAYQPARIPAGTYRGQAHAVSSASIQNFLVTREDLPADVVYRMTKSMFDNLERLAAAHPAAAAIRREDAAANPPVPIHAGSEKYYREMSLIR
jgi:TRAP transporter TAXI family solute receptor